MCRVPRIRERGKEHPGPRTLTDAQHEVVEGLVVDVCERILHGQGKVSQIGQVLPALLVRLLLLGRGAAARASGARTGPSPPATALCR